MFDVNNKDAQYFVDSYNMFLTQNFDWDPSGNNDKEDSIGTNCLGYITYGYEPFINAVKNCYVDKGTYIEAFRHPSFINLTPNTMSRDHIIYTLVLMKYAKEEEFLKNLAKKLKWKISDRYSFTLEIWLWMKGIAGNKFYMLLYYLLDIPLMTINVLWNKLIKKLGNFGSEIPQNKYNPLSASQISKKQLFLRKLIYPIYALHEKGFMMYVSPNCLGKTIIKKLGAIDVYNENYLLKLLFGKNVTEEEVNNYLPSTAWRWDTALNNINDRDVKIITNPKRLEANVLDVDLLKTIYKNIEYEKRRTTK